MSVCEPYPTAAKPMLARCAGVPPASLLQSPQFPMGGTVGLGSLIVIQRWQGIVGAPGDKVMVSGQVLARVIDRAAGPTPAAVFELDGPSTAAGVSITDATVGLQTAAVPVKLRIRKCKVPDGGVLIDSDSHIVMDGGTELEVAVMAPFGWVAIPPLSNAPPPVEDGLYVNVNVTVCPLRCCWPPTGTLTWYDTTPVDGDVIVRPNRARRLQVWGPVPAGTVWRGHTDSQLSGIDQQLGDQQLNGGFTNTDLWPGAAAAFELVSGGGAGAISWRWEIS
jgi:hypothetical protein